MGKKEFEQFLNGFKPTRKSRKAEHPEHDIQCACVRWFRFQYPEHERLMIAIPNGGRRDRITAARLKEEGVMAGAPDLFLFLPNRLYHGLAIEMKTNVGRQSPSQKEWQFCCESEGYRYELCRSLDEFIAIIKDYMKERGKVCATDGLR